jgi:hypothetical protein
VSLRSLSFELVPNVDCTFACKTLKGSLKFAGKGDIDPVIEHLLHNARREAVKQQFFSTPPEEYTTAHNLKLLVSPYSLVCRSLTGVSKPPIVLGCWERI